MSEDTLEIQNKQRRSNAVERILMRAGRHHFAFLRAYLEGLDIKSISKRYLENDTFYAFSMAETLSTLQWIRKDLCNLARQHNKFAYARIINIDPSQLASDTVKPVMSLAAFQEERDPDEMYSESELIDLFNEEFGVFTANPKLERNLRLLKKQVEALNWMEGLVSVDPVLNDSIDVWLVPAVANRLMDSSIFTIDDLLTRINTKGHKWHTGINQLGSVTSARIIKWLSFYSDKIGSHVGTLALVKRSKLNVERIKAERKQEHGIVPLEYFLPRPEMDGSCGENRGVRNRTGVENDFDAIHLWLKQQENINTYRSYRKEAERFLLWALLERGKPFSSLLTEDCLAYRNFLRDLGRLDENAWALTYKIPMERWVGRRGTERWSTLWRPFEKRPTKKIPKTNISELQKTLKTNSKEEDGILSPASQKLSHTILKSLCDYLSRQRYLDFNPFDGVKAPNKGKLKMNVGRSFSFRQWQFIIDHLDSQKRDAHYFRLKFILCFAYETGMRISEMVNAKLSDIEEVVLAGTAIQGRVIHVLGKGDIIREVVITDVVFKELETYLEHRGLGTFIEAPKDRPLIDALVGVTFPFAIKDKDGNVELRDPSSSISVNRLHKILKDFFVSASVAMLSESISESHHIANASTHWLRHTCGSHAAANGILVQILQQNFGHASLDTTTQYVTTERDVRIIAMEENSKRASERNKPKLS